MTSPATAPEEVPEGAIGEHDAGACDVLVVDDEPANHLSMRVALEGIARGVVGARSGAEALRKLLEEDFAVILLDVKMPTMDGFETAQLIQSRERTRHIPIIFITAADHTTADVERAYAVGAADYLSKPIVPQVLRAKVDVFIQLQKRTQEVARKSEQLRAMEREQAQRRLAEAERSWQERVLRREMEEQRRINERLAEEDRRKDEFIATLSHELRNPLAPLVAGIEVLRDRIDSEPAAERALEAMTRQVGHLTRLVDDILDMSRISRGKIELQRQPLRLQDIVTRAVETCAGTIEEAGHELTVHGTDEDLWLEGDAVRLNQVVSNLLNNASRYTPAGGHIELRYGRGDDGGCFVSVRDDGIGIAPDLKERVFDMFVQGRDHGHGLGLGLALVRQLVELHGGTVDVHSEGEGEGAEFTVRFEEAPATPAADQADGESSAAGSSLDDPQGPAVRVVVVDDDPDIRDLVAQLLGDWGYEVDTAKDGREGVERILEARPDVAIVDLGMPKLDGYGLARQVEEQMGEGRPALVAMTGFGQPRDVRRVQESGFDAHMVKPATPDDIARVLEEVTGGCRRTG